MADVNGRADVFPRRNLGLSEYWGRVVETRLKSAEKEFYRSDLVYTGGSRSESSQVQDLSRQLTLLEGALLQIPTTGSNSASTSGFALATGWNTVLSFSIPVTGGKTNLNIVAKGQATVKDEGPTEALFQWPFPLEYVTSEYGPREGGFHSGIDFAGGPASAGSPIYAPGSGSVIGVGFNSSMGNYVILTHPAGLTTRYFHLQSPSPLSVGDSVTKAVTVLGYVGNTGASFGAHLHWETYINGSPPNEEGENAMDPRDFMSIYGSAGSGGGGEYGNILSRIVINSNNSLDFEPYKIFYSGSPDYIVNYVYPVHGLSFLGSSVTVNLDVYSSAPIPAVSENIASLSAFGVFA